MAMALCPKGPEVIYMGKRTDEILIDEILIQVRNTYISCISPRESQKELCPELNCSLQSPIKYNFYVFKAPLSVSLYGGGTVPISNSKQIC